MKTETPVLLAAAVDRLALIKAQMSDLAAEEKALKEWLEVLGMLEMLEALAPELHASLSPCQCAPGACRLTGKPSRASSTHPAN
jgi:hypothetical protein